MAYKSSYDLDRPWKQVMEELADDDVHEEFYASRNPFVSYMHNRRIAVICDLIEREAATRVLEVGCGDGFVLEALSEKTDAELTGIELSETRLARARRRAPGARLVLGDARQLPFASDAFDLVICTEVLEHIPEPERAINEIRRVTRVGGIAVVTVPNETNWRMGRAMLLRFPIRIPDHVNQFTVRSMNGLFDNQPLRLICLPPLSRFLSLTNVFVYRIT